MEDTAKYLIHADFVADGVIERSDVVGAVFGQTEGLLGDELELRDLQESSKLGRIDVEVTSTGGQSQGTITIASSLDRVETATLAAALEAIERIGPSQASVEIQRIEDVRAAKRREVVERAKELLATAFDEQVMDSRAILEEVRESIRVEDIIEYEGLPAGPRVEASDAVIVVEGRADVRNLLRYGIKNAIAVEGTDVPEPVAELTVDRTATAFLDGDRGGELIREELMQVGDLDYVALSPPDRSVEDLSRHEVHTALQEKIPVEALEVRPSEEAGDSPAETLRGSTQTRDNAEAVAMSAEAGSVAEVPSGDTSERVEETAEQTEAETLADHVSRVAGTDTIRILDDQFETLGTGDASDAQSLVEEAGTTAATVIMDGTVNQKSLDAAAERGISRVYATDQGDIVKQPATVRIRSLDEF
ncbi:DNA primase DnaG [Halodesulfurarchaeum sp.]|uniref:DNA primase DnaG n=1 Tax=Halodesulfurarchaeum sp. TaxID=1980530 RepID=UPI002FC3A8A4